MPNKNAGQELTSWREFNRDRTIFFPKVGGGVCLVSCIFGNLYKPIESRTLFRIWHLGPGLNSSQDYIQVRILLNFGKKITEICKKFIKIRLLLLSDKILFCI